MAQFLVWQLLYYPYLIMPSATKAVVEFQTRVDTWTSQDLPTQEQLDAGDDAGLISSAAVVIESRIKINESGCQKSFSVKIMVISDGSILKLHVLGKEENGHS
ncbi:hypothetical protein AgCh_025026 [Apium graveolens]